jgi:hypothetical protein
MASARVASLLQQQAAMVTERGSAENISTTRLKLGTDRNKTRLHDKNQSLSAFTKEHIKYYP